MDEAAIATLRRQLVSAVRRACPPWLASRADDLVQTALLRIVDPSGGDGGKTVPHPSYLRKVAYSVVVDEMRRNFHRTEIQEDPEVGLDANPGGVPSPENALASRSLYRALLVCLGDLDRPRRAAVACHLQGYSVPESADFLGWTKKKTEHLVRRGLTDLRACLGEKGIEP
jgi:DNA-directed RNA polymerase specialized sigma24 family protein